MSLLYSVETFGDPLNIHRKTLQQRKLSNQMLQTKHVPTSYTMQFITKHCCILADRIPAHEQHADLFILNWCFCQRLYMVELPRMLWVDSTAASASPFSKLSIYNTRQNTSRRQLVALPRRVGATKSGKPPVPRFIKFSSVYACMCVCVCVPKLISGAGCPAVPQQTEENSFQ